MSSMAGDGYKFWQSSRSLVPGDGRLKILWIEDNPDQYLPEYVGELDKWFSLLWVSSPVAAKALLHASQGGDLASQTDSHGVYASRGLPCDGVISDFRLCDGVEGSPGCTLKAHEDLGLHAPSAGFLVAVLTSLWYPEHPQCIVPYSAFEREFGQVWALTKQLCPDTLAVKWDERISKSAGVDRDSEAVLRHAVAQYRDALSGCIRKGHLDIPPKQFDTWSQAVRGSGDVDATEKIWLTTPYGLRPYLIGALFFDASNGQKVPCAKIAEWLKALPEPSDVEEQEARRLASCYFALRCSEESQFVYRGLYCKRNGLLQGTLPEQLNAFPALNEYAKGKGEQNKRIVRLAMLYLLLREHAARTSTLSESAEQFLCAVTGLRLSGGISDADIAEELAKYAQKADDGKSGACRDSLSLLDKLGEALAEVESNPVAVQRLQDLKTAIGLASANGEDVWARHIRGADVGITDDVVIQLLDPLPATWEQPLTVNTSHTVFKWWSRAWSGSEQYNIMDLVRGDSEHISPSEQLRARRYARQLGLLHNQWPAWLD